MIADPKDLTRSDVPTQTYLQATWNERKQRFSHRDRVGAKVRDLLTNRIRISVKDVQGSEDPLAGNLVAAGHRTTTQRLARMPKLQAEPSADQVQPNSTEALRRAERHELRLIDHTRKMDFQQTLFWASSWWAAHGVAFFTMFPDTKLGIPRIVTRDPLSAYPGNLAPHTFDAFDCLFVQHMPGYKAAQMYPQCAEVFGSLKGNQQTQDFTIGEYWDNAGCTYVLLEPQVRILDFIPSITPDCPTVYIAQGFSPDLDFHGQFDGAIGPMMAQNKFWVLALAYLEQMVANETVVVGDILSNQGRWAYGYGAVNQLEKGGQAEKLNNRMSPDVFTLSANLERNTRASGGIPAQLQGEPVASFATGKGLEQLTLTVDDNVAYGQAVLSAAMRKMFIHYPHMAKAMEAKGANDYSGDVEVFVRFQSGADPAETVRLLQFQGAKILSRRTISSRLPEIDDPDAEDAEIEVEALTDALLASLQSQAESGQLPPGVIAEITQRKLKTLEPLAKVVSDVMSAQAPAPEQAPSLADLMAAGGQGQMTAPMREAMMGRRAEALVPEQMAQMGGA